MHMDKTSMDKNEKIIRTKSTIGSIRRMSENPSLGAVLISSNQSGTAYPKPITSVRTDMARGKANTCAHF